ncbi:hypothetical protein HN51_018382 [Arachis hypogaea]|uniref:NAD kinase 2, chloroplastic n=1 Tax=Arachis hypogaea TaxID=3818 RepID=UPI000DEC0A54|nr:NAD kinase 2, chloroplastic [Arachis hypogaea]QHO29944.1 NAD kinase 2 [Arachis hypogaea]
MVACLCTCHLVYTAMNLSASAAVASSLSLLSSFSFLNPNPSPSPKTFAFGFRFKTKGRSTRGVRRPKSLVTAQLSNSFSFSFGLDSQSLNDIQSHDPSQLPWVGPVPGDIAEVEAYCRIFRNYERLHSSLMNVLCNPLTGECSVSDEVPSDERLPVEDKIVSVLGCMVALVNTARDDVLSGRRSSVMTPFRVAGVGVMEDVVPPLAAFRSEMKRCCESLHVALENYLVPGDNPRLDAWRKLQRLKNVCYDAGFPHREEDPCPELFSNWSPVYLSAPKEDTKLNDSEAGFWTGGQVTEEGLKWLLDNGYKTIIDLRQEAVKDNLYHEAVNDAISSGKIELVKIPVDVQRAPTMEQVERFASYVSNYRKRPIYLHSQEGVWRTSAMVSRWRQYMTRFASSFVSNEAVTSSERPSDYTNGSAKLHDSSIESERSRSSAETDDNLLQESLGAVTPNSSRVITGSENNASMNFSSKTIPLEAQIPPRDIFSKREMSRFWRNRKIPGPSYFNYKVESLECLTDSRNMHAGRPQGKVTISNGDNPVAEIVDRESLNGSPRVDYPSGEPPITVGGDWKSVNGSTSNFGKTTVYELSEGDVRYMNNSNVTMTKSQSDDGKAGLALHDEDLGLMEGDMCASSTGVVRVQSRKKAEMYLVRTDGVSCEREKVTESSLAFTHPSTQQQMLMWKSTPKTVLLLKKPGEQLMEEAKEVASFLYYQEKMNIFVEPDVHDIFARLPGFEFIQTFYIQDTSVLHEKVDFVACLGGDGVILHASNLFGGAIPPVVSFNLGSLGFLASHSFEDYRQDLRQVIHGNNTGDGVYITLRMRLRCEIFRKGKAMPGKVFDILNEVVIDRGSNPYLSKIECYEHDRLITKVQGDGVIVATPTGSTAYSTAAGGSMVHPNVPCMLFTPICPHSLSFRPVILPDSARLELKIPEDARSNAWVSFDGKRRQQLSRGDSVRISMSQHPLPTVNKFDQTGDWFHSLIRCLNWNERLDQKAL